MDKFLTNRGILDVVTSGNILDLGCGKGLDVIQFAKKGSFVIDAVDHDSASIDFLNEKIKSESISNIHTHLKSIEDFKIESEKYSIIIASNSLPFISSKEKVVEIIGNISKGLKQDGFAYITLFGLNDDWKNKKNMSFFSLEEATKIFDDLGLKKYFISTEEGYGKTMKGDVKFWNVHKFIYQK